MKFILEIECDNAAFDGPYGDECPVEVGSILDAVSAQLYSGAMPKDPIVLFDTNGNRVGKAEFVK